jgi:hypothetical protein
MLLHVEFLKAKLNEILEREREGEGELNEITPHVTTRIVKCSITNLKRIVLLFYGWYLIDSE